MSYKYTMRKKKKKKILHCLVVVSSISYSFYYLT
jgi:hypothetical protein